MECLSLVKHPEEHKKEIRLRGVQGIIFVLGGLIGTWCAGMKEHQEKRIMTSTLNSTEEIHEGFV